MGESSAFLDVDLSTLAISQRALAEILITALNRAVQRLEDVVTRQSGEITALTATVADLQTNVETRDKELSELRDRLNTLEDQVDSNVAYEKRDCLIVSGGVPPVSDGEDCSEIIRQLIRNSLRINMSPNDISSAHRFGKKPITQAPDKRSIIIKLHRTDLKKDILSACREFKPPFFVNESLTPTRSQVMFVLRKARGDHPDKLRTPRTYDGNVNAYVPMPGEPRPGQHTKFRRVVVNSRRGLDELLMQHIGCTSEKYVKDWPTRAQ